MVNGMRLFAQLGLVLTVCWGFAPHALAEEAAKADSHAGKAAVSEVKDPSVRPGTPEAPELDAQYEKVFDSLKKVTSGGLSLKKATSWDIKDKTFKEKDFRGGRSGAHGRYQKEPRAFERSP